MRAVRRLVLSRAQRWMSSLKQTHCHDEKAREAIISSPSGLVSGAAKMRSSQTGGFSLRALQRTNTFPTTGIRSHQAEIIDRNLRAESAVALVTIAALRQPSV